MLNSRNRCDRFLRTAISLGLIAAPGLAQDCPPQSLFASDGTKDDYFGYALSISGDAMVVGAFGGPAAGIGVAYVYRKSNGVWVYEATLTASDPGFGEEFGFAVGISGDTIVVGAHQDRIGASPERGSAYVFVRIGGVWTQQQKLLASDSVSGDLFGNAVAISGDTIIVGMAGDNEGFDADVGAAYIFRRAGIVWTEEKKLVAPAGQANDFFGFSVAISGDTAIAGAFSDNGPLTAQGSACIFTRSGGTWPLQQQIFVSDAVADDNFGFSVAIDGNTAVVGAASKQVVAPGAREGAAYVFTRSGSTWSQQQRFLAADGANDDAFGASVAISGDRVLVGAPSNDANATSGSGAAYPFTRSGTTWNAQPKLTAPNAEPGEVLGISVAITPDTIAAGASGDRIGVNLSQGSVRVFLSCECVGDLNGDGQVDDADFVLFVSAYNLLDCTDLAMPPGCPADFNDDGFVDDADFVLFVSPYDALVCP